jgi:hypothetical protein
MMTLETHATTPRHASSSPVRMLLKYPAKETDAERGRLDALVQCTEREGWRQALERTLGDDEGLMCYITDPARSRFIDAAVPAQRRARDRAGPGPVHDAARAASMRQGDTRATDLAMRLLPAALVPHFTPGLMFLARRDGA